MVLLNRYFEDDKKRMAKFFAQLEGVSDNSRSTSDRSTLDEWVVTNAADIEALMQQKETNEELLQPIRKAEKWLKPIPLYNPSKRRGNIPGYSHTKLEHLKKQGISSVQEFAFIDNACARTYINSEDTTKSYGRLRCDISFEKKIEAVRRKLCEKQKLATWEDYKRKHNEMMKVLDGRREINLYRSTSQDKENVRASDGISTKEEKTLEVTYNVLRFTFSARCVDLICEARFKRVEPFWKQLISHASPTDFWKIDNTFKICKRLKIDHPLSVSSKKSSMRPFKSCLTIQNAYGQYLGLHMNFGEGNMVETEPYITALLQRCRDLRAEPDYTPKVVVVDNCCSVREKYKEVLGKQVLVKLDLFHWLDRWTKCLAVPIGHERRKEFFQDMTDAVLVADKAEFQEKIQVSELQAQWMDEDIHHILSKQCQRRPNPPDVMYENVMKVLEFYLNRIDRNVNNGRDRRKLFEASKSKCKDCKMFANTIASCGSCTWGLSELTFKHSGSSSVYKVLETQLEHVKKGCLSYPKDVNLHHKNLSGKTFKCDSTGHNECGHLHLLKPFKGGNYAPMKMQRYLLRIVVNANKRAAEKRDLDFPLLEPEDAILNSLAGNFTNSPEMLPFSRIAPFAAKNYHLGIETISPIEDIDLAPRKMELRRLKAVIDKASLHKHPMALPHALIAAGKFSSNKMSDGLLDKMNDCWGYESQILKAFGTIMRCNIAVLMMKDGVPSRTPQVKFAKEGHKDRVIILKKDTGFVALKPDKIEEVLQRTGNPKNGKTSEEDRARKVCVLACNGSLAFQILQEKSQSTLPLPTPFLFDTVNDESTLFDKLVRENKALALKKKPSRGDWEKIELRWNECVKENVLNQLVSTDYKAKRLFGKLWNHLRDYHKYKLELLPERLPDKSVEVYVSDERKEIMQALHVHKDHPPPMQSRDRTLPVPIPPSFPRVFANYQDVLPGTQLPGMPVLANPDIAENKLAPYAPVNARASDEIAEAHRAEPSSWINRKLICRNCDYPYGKYKNKATHKYEQYSGKRVRVCVNAVKMQDLHNYSGGMFDKRVCAQKSYKRKGGITLPKKKTTKRKRVVDSGLSLEILSTLSTAELRYSLSTNENILFGKACALNEPQLVFNYFNRQITKEKLVSPFGFDREGNWLKDGNIRRKWLNDEIINLWVKKIERDNHLQPDASDHFYFNTFFYSQLFANEKFNFENVKSWTKSSKNIFASRKVFVPVNNKNAHWLLCVVCFEHKTIYIYDSGKTDKDLADKVYKNVLEYLKCIARADGEEQIMDGTWKIDYW